jgi:hypothetical protein
MLLEQGWPLGSQDVSQGECAQGECGDDRVIQLARNRHEVGDQVQGHQEVGHETKQHHLPPPRHPTVPEQVFQENDAVRDKPAKGAGIRPASGNEQRHNEQRVIARAVPAINRDQVTGDIARAVSRE